MGLHFQTKTALFSAKANKVKLYITRCFTYIYNDFLFNFFIFYPQALSFTLSFYLNKPCNICYIDNKKATEVLNGKGFQLPRSFNLNGLVNTIQGQSLIVKKNETEQSQNRSRMMKYTGLNTLSNAVMKATRIMRKNLLLLFFLLLMQ